MEFSFSKGRSGNHIPFKYLFSILIIAALIRVLFLVIDKPLPVMWDARIYSSAAIGSLYYLDKSDSFGHSGEPSKADFDFSQIQFETCLKKYIQGEQINWLYYNTPTVQKAQDYLFISGPVYPFFLAGLFYLIPSYDFPVIRVINMVIDLVCLYLMMMIAMRLFGKRTALIAGLIYAVYFPFMILMGMISPDSLTLLMTLLTVFMMLKYYQTKRGWYIYLVGLVLGLLVLNRSTAALLFVPVLIGFLYDWRKSIRSTALLSLKAAVPFVIIMVPWLIITHGHFDQLTLRDPGYSEANFRSSSMVPYEGYDLDYVEKDFWTASVSENIFDDIPGYLKLLVKKFRRLWGDPYNDFKQSFILPPAAFSVIHLLIILPALWGIFGLLLFKKKGYIFLLLIPGYYTLIHIIFHSLSRYNLNAMPYLIIIASAVMVLIYDKIKADRSLLLRLSAAGLGLLVVFFFPDKWAVWYMGAAAGNLIILFLKFVILITVLTIIWIYLIKYGFKTTFKICVFPFVTLLILFLVLGGQRETWAEWKTRIESHESYVGSIIHIPRDFRVEGGELVRIGIDFTTIKDMQNPVMVYLNGTPSSIRFNQAPFDYYYTQKGTYPVYDEIMNFGKEQMRAWRFIPMKPELFNYLVGKYGVIDISLSMGDSVYNPGEYIEIYGSYTDDGDILQMPSVTTSSVERFIEKGDRRSPVDYKFSSDSVISYYIENIRNRDVNREDLSGLPGRQQGRFRIYIEVMKSNRQRYYF